MCDASRGRLPAGSSSGTQPGHPGLLRGVARRPMARRPEVFGAHAPRLLAAERVCGASLRAACASYLWRLQAERAALVDRLADLDVAFRWLLQVQDGEETAALLHARAGYVAALHAAHPDLAEAIDDLAGLHQDLITAALDEAEALSLPSTRLCGTPRSGPAVSHGVWSS